MTWLTWRQHRAEMYSLGLLVAVIAAFLLLAGLPMHSLFPDGAGQCVGSDVTDACSNAIRRLAEDHGYASKMLSLFNLVPFLIGAFFGAPLVARELELGTWQFAWTQSVPRMRWLAVKLGALGVLTAALAGAFSAVITWYRQPMDVLDGRFTAELAEQCGGGEVLDHLVRVRFFDGHESHRDVGDRLGQHTAHAEQDRHPELLVAGEADDELTGGAQHGATSRSTSPSASVAAASSSVAACSAAAASARPSRTRPRSVLCAMPSPLSFTATAPPNDRAASAASAGVAATISGANGTPKPRSSSFEAASASVRPATGTPADMAAYPSDPWRGLFAA